MNLFPTNDDKLLQLILHVTRLYQQRDTFNLAQLSSILFYADFNHFKRVGFPITGQTYFKRLDCLAPHNMLTYCQTLYKQEKIILSPGNASSFFSEINIKYQSEPILKIFDGEEIALVDEIAYYFQKQNFISPYSPFQIAGTELIHLNEEIPYYLALIEGKRFIPNEFEAKHAEQLKTLAHESRVSVV